MQQSKVESMPVWGLWVSGSSLLLVALTAGGLSLSVNVVAGLSIGLPLAVMFGLSDVGKVLLPMVCQSIGWDRRARITYRLAAIASVVCALWATADMFGIRLAQVGEVAKAAHTVEQRITDLRSALETTQQMAKDEAKRGGCGTNCKALNARVEGLEKEIKAVVESSTSNLTPTVTGVGFLGNVLTGYTPTTVDTGTTVVLVLFSILMMELFCHMSGAATSMISLAMRRGRELKIEKQKKAEAEAKKKIAAEKRAATLKKKAAEKKKAEAAAKKIAAASDETKAAEVAKKLAAAEKIIEAKKVAMEKKNLAAAKRRALAAEKKAAAEAKRIAAAAKKAAARKAAAEKKANREARQALRVVK